MINYSLEFIEDSNLDEVEEIMTDIQKVLLQMLSWFHYFCIDNQLTYYVAGGTTLGTMRHRGFIPWDDDVDVIMPRKDYDKLISITPNINGRYIFETPYSNAEDYLYSYVKLYDSCTTLAEKHSTICRRGVYIDVFPLDGIGDELEDALKTAKQFDKKNMLLMTRTCSLRKDRAWYKNFSIIIAKMIPNFLLNNKELAMELEIMAKKINNDNSKYVANLMGSYREKEVLLREWLGTPTLYSFENIQVYGPEQYDEYLRHIYGDWKQLPPEEKRKTTHDYVELDLNHSYKRNN